MRQLGFCLRPLALAGTALAAPFAEADESVQLDPVQVTATRNGESRFSAAQPVTVLTSKEISERSPQVLTELLRGEAGVYFQQTGPGQGVAIVRGLKGGEVLHLVDGFRLNNSFFRTAPSQYIALVDPWNIAQLEVLRGAYGSLYGSDAMGGVIQLRTAENRFSGDAVQYKTDATLHFASADLAKVGRISHAVGNDTLSVSAGLTRSSYGSRRIGGLGQAADGRGRITLDTRVGPSGYNAGAYDLKTIWAFAADQELTFSAQYYGTEDLPRYNEVVPGFGRTAAVAESIYDNDRAFYHLRYRYSAPMALVDSLELHLGRQVINDDRFDLSNNLTTNTFESNRSTLDGFTAQAESHLGRAHKLSYGIELYQDKVKSSKTVVETGATTTTTVSGPNSPNSVKARFPDGAESDNYGVYVVDHWAMTPRLASDLGLRYSKSKSRLPKADRLAGGEVQGSDTTGSLGLRYAITPALAATFNIGSGFRAPNINDLGQTGRRSGSPPRITTANNNLKPEKLLSADTGLKWRSGGLTGEATVFYSDYKDRISLLPTGRSIPKGTEGCPSGANAPNCIEVQNVNIAEASYYGFEGALRYAFSPRLAARATLNYTHSEQQVSGATEPGNRTPPLNGQLSAEWSPIKRLVLEPSLWFNDSQTRLDATDRADNRINPTGSAGFAVINLRAAYTFSAAYRLQLFGENLLDKSYREHGSGIDGRGRGVGLTLEGHF